MKPKKMNKDGKWITDSDEVSLDLIDKITFKNAVIENFLSYEDKFFVCAVKGIGKTLLLRKKRELLERQYSRNMTFIPSDKPFIDTAESFGDIPIEEINYFTELVHCKKLWSMAFKISAISYHVKFHPTNEKLIEIFDFFGFGRTEKVLPTDIVEILFYKGISSFEKFQKKYANTINRLFRNYVQSGTFIFIDRIDQALLYYKGQKNSRKFWIYMQAGLVEAAWEVKRSNQHVKIYTSIRQEAYVNYASENKNAMESQVSFIRYSIEDLHNILNKLSSAYERKKSFYDFIGFRELQNNFCGKEENTFDYIYRHTTGRPRDLVQVCSNYSTINPSTEENYRGCVNKISSLIIENYFEEQSVFLDALEKANDRTKLFSFIDTNILSFNELEEVCCKFNDFNIQNFQLHETYKHPLCELYNIGLLGTIKANIVENGIFQNFLQPYERNNLITATLPKSRYYLIHPSLGVLIDKAKSNNHNSYNLIPNVIVGNGRKWDTDDETRIFIIKSLRLQSKSTEEFPEIFEFLEKNIMREKISDKKTFLDKTINSLQSEFAKTISKEIIDKASHAFSVIVGST